MRRVVRYVFAAVVLVGALGLLVAATLGIIMTTFTLA